MRGGGAACWPQGCPGSPPMLGAAQSPCAQGCAVHCPPCALVARSTLCRFALPPPCTPHRRRARLLCHGRQVRRRPHLHLVRHRLQPPAGARVLRLRERARGVGGGGSGAPSRAWLLRIACGRCASTCARRPVGVDWACSRALLEGWWAATRNLGPLLRQPLWPTPMRPAASRLQVMTQYEFVRQAIADPDVR